MKRKIAAILAADIAGYSRLVAEDEEDTLRRLENYRGVFSDFVTRCGGRIFNTAGDATLAEFASAVDAIRCAVDVQESLRTRNLAYTPSRQMSFRIGITIGDVVERDGDLLGDGVNIASRLESFAPVGGICISRSVYEAVANKISLKFDNLGPLQLKNIPDRVHAFTATLDQAARGPAQTGSSAWPIMSTAAVLAVLMIAVAGAGVYFLARSSLPIGSSSEVGDTGAQTATWGQGKRSIDQAGKEIPATPALPDAKHEAHGSAHDSASADAKSGAQAPKDETAAADAPAAVPTATSAPEPTPSSASEKSEQADTGEETCPWYLPSVGKTVKIPCERAQDRAQATEKPGEVAAKLQNSVFVGQWAHDSTACATTHSSDASVRFVPGGFSIYPYSCTQREIRPPGSATEMDGECHTSVPGFSSNEVVKLTIEGDRLSISGDTIHVRGYVRCGASTANVNEPATIAALPPATASSPDEVVQRSKAPSEERRAGFIRDLQKALSRHNCYSGTIDGDASEAARGLSQLEEQKPYERTIDLSNANFGEFDDLLVWMDSDELKDVQCPAAAPTEVEHESQKRPAKKSREQKNTREDARPQEIKKQKPARDVRSVRTQAKPRVETRPLIPREPADMGIR